MQKIKKWVRSRGFTLIELLVAIGILAVISSVTVLTLNPAELFKQSRDANRFSSLASLRKAINLFQLNNGAPSAMGVQNVVYVSLPDSASNCSSWQLPDILPRTYQCVLPADLVKANGSGWIPINFEGGGRSLLPALPIDPVNSFDHTNPNSGYFYIYATDGAGKYEIDAKTESVKYGSGN